MQAVLMVIRIIRKSALYPLNIGNWWNASEEIDLVALGETNALLVEAQWSNKPVGIDILANLERKASLIISDLDGRQIRFALYSRAGFTGK
jgi:hypothetical protein